jgi:hypothetical protein
VKETTTLDFDGAIKQALPLLRNFRAAKMDSIVVYPIAKP